MEKFLVEFNEYEPKYIQIANNIKNSTLEIIKGEKHGSYIIHSDKIYKIIKNF